MDSSEDTCTVAVSVKAGEVAEVRVEGGGDKARSRRDYRYAGNVYRIETTDAEKAIMVTREDEPADEVYVRLTLDITHGKGRDCAALGYKRFHSVYDSAGVDVVETLTPREVIDETCAYLAARIEAHYNTEKVRAARAERRKAANAMTAFIERLPEPV